MKNTLIKFVPLTMLAIFIIILPGCKDGFWTKERIDPPCPEVSVIAPTAASFGTKVTIRGSLFQANIPGLYEVRIGNELVDSLEIPDENTMTFRVPKGIESGAVTVHLKGACDAKVKPAFTYLLTATNVVRFAGMFGQVGSVACPSCLNTPSGIEVDGAGNVWVADKLNHVVRRYNKDNPSGDFSLIGTFKSPGCDNNEVSIGVPAHFNQPIDIAVNSAGDLFISEEMNPTIKRRISAGNVFPYAGKCDISNFDEGDCISGTLGTPYRIAQDGFVTYIADSGKIRTVDATVNPTCPTIRNFINNQSPSLTYAFGIEFSKSLLPDFGPIFVTDISKQTIKSVSLTGVVKDISTTGEAFNKPSSLVLDNQGNIFVADEGKHQILVVYPGGKTVILAGTGNAGIGIDGVTDNVPGLEARFNTPTGIAIDPKNNKILYVSDSQNHVIRKITIE